MDCGNHSAGLCSLTGRYDNPIPTRILVPIDCLKIPAQAGRINSLESIPGLHKRSEIRALDCSIYSRGANYNESI